MGLSWRGRVAALAGDLQLALSTGEEAAELQGSIQTVGLFTWFAGNLAATLLTIGDAQRAKETILERAGGPDLADVPPIDHARQYALLADAELALDAVEAAAGWADRALRVAERLALPVSGAHAGRARARVLSARGDQRAAAEAALARVAAAEQAGAAIEAAQLRLVAGQALASAGDRDGAIAQLEPAEDAFAACGAERLRREASAELRRLGRRRPLGSARGRRDAAGLEALSQREREIATLVHQRRTNPQIAQELFLSPKTVEAHLRNVFRKLGVSSRVEVAQVVERDQRDAMSR